MIESRCGILCSQCAYKTSLGCAGCVNIKKPFWADACPLKNCCEEKQHPHCGSCKSFPCGLLHQFAYDQEQGDEGKRIAQCAQWQEGKED